VSELHVYISPNGSAIPSRTRWMLELREGSWEDFEQGRTIKAEIVAKARDPKPSGLATEEEIIQKSKEEPSNYSKALLDEVAQYYYFHHYIYWLKDQNKTPTTEPIINVEGLKPTKVILSKDQFGIRFE